MENEEQDEEFLAVSNSHGWARNPEKSEAIENALSNSAYISDGDEVKVNVYRCEPDTVMSNMGQIGIWMRKEDNEKADLEEETISEKDHYMRGSDPLVKIERHHFVVESDYTGKDFNKQEVEELNEVLHDEE